MHAVLTQIITRKSKFSFLDSRKMGKLSLPVEYACHEQAHDLGFIYREEFGRHFLRLCGRSTERISNQRTKEEKIYERRNEYELKIRQGHRTKAMS